MITARPPILIKVTFLKHFALEVWVSIFSSNITLNKFAWVPRANGPIELVEECQIMACKRLIDTSFKSPLQNMEPVVSHVIPLT